MGGGAFLGFGPKPPKLTIASYSPGDLEKNGFCLGGIGPHSGELWGFEIWHFLAFWRTLAYFSSELCRHSFDFLTASDSYVGRLTIAEISRKLISWNSSNVDRKLGWGTFGALWGFTPFGGSHPHLTHASYSSVDPEKNGFCLGGIGPHLGEICGFEIWLFLAFWRTLAYFSSELCRQIFDF